MFERTSRKFKKWNSQLLEQQLLYVTKNIERRMNEHHHVLFCTNTKENTKQAFFSGKIAQLLARKGKRVLYFQLYEHKARRTGLSRMTTVQEGDHYKISRTVVGNVDDLQVYDLELVSSVFEERLEVWKESYEYIVVEAPEMMKNMYSQWILSSSDAVVLFVKRKRTKRNDMQQSKEYLVRQQKVLLGVVYEH
ncbi:hypothetical protein [Geomicrobium sp. JCM 19055]|uniref:hypothetical protein n=1 Tax=Geomicrobium sp. JCM 19055 TaxID=1460649 RepID=UPI00045ED77E|nr:hypothetical protein [Geomicrobium sp. JCM 19055]GAJ98043.1 hypothetical protein JCM19055_944 [Geomicrobium sp. JCM 19055]